MVIAEAAKRVSQTTRRTLPNISWQEINGMRNRLVHEYDDANLNIVWDTVQTEIPTLIAAINSVVVIELSDRGSVESVGVVTDVGLFLSL